MNAKLSGKRALRLIRAPNIRNNIGGQLCCALHFATRHSPSHIPFSPQVSHVVVVSAEEQMIWIHARFHIALVAHHFACRNSAIHCFVSRPMRTAPNLPPVYLRRNVAISISGVAVPQPAPTIGLRRSAAKNFFNWEHGGTDAALQAWASWPCVCSLMG